MKLSTLLPSVLFCLIAATKAQESISLPVTIPVTVPLTVRAGESFDATAKAFCERNGVSLNYVSALSEALKKEWERIQAVNQVTRCFKWQRRYSVSPMKSWGSLPDSLRIQWLELNCNTIVPANPPSPSTSVDVRVYDRVVPMEFFEGDTVEEIVHDFCVANGIDETQYGEALRNALNTKIQQVNEAAKNAAPADNAQQQQAQRGEFLFAVPVQIDNRLVKLNVHEGDQLGALVGNFCAENGLDVEQHGTILKEKVMESLTQLQQQLLAEVEKDKAQAAAAQQKLEENRPIIITVTFNIDGNVVPLHLREGDELGTRVSEFCKENNLKEEEHGQILRTAILEKYRAFKQAQEDQATAQ